MPFSGTENAKIKLDDFAIINLKKAKLLGIIFCDRLKSQYHIEKKASWKLTFCRSITIENFIQCLFFSHSLATTFWFRCPIAEHLMFKTDL